MARSVERNAAKANRCSADTRGERPPKEQLGNEPQRDRVLVQCTGAQRTQSSALTVHLSTKAKVQCVDSTQKLTEYTVITVRP